MITEALPEIATQPTDSPYVVLGQPPKNAPAIEPTPSPSNVLFNPGSSNKSFSMIEDRFLWSAICSANTTNATGMYATATVPKYDQLKSLNPLNALINVKLGTQLISLNTEKLITIKFAFSVKWPITVKIVATRYPAIIPIINGILCILGASMKNVRNYKIVYATCSAIWIYYNYMVGAYVVIISNVLEITSAIIGYERHK